VRQGTLEIVEHSVGADLIFTKKNKEGEIEGKRDPWIEEERERKREYVRITAGWTGLTVTTTEHVSLHRRSRQSPRTLISLG
jgi:hypothetical protein